MSGSEDTKIFYLDRYCHTTDEAIQEVVELYGK